MSKPLPPHPSYTVVYIPFTDDRPPTVRTDYNLGYLVTPKHPSVARLFRTMLQFNRYLGSFFYDFPRYESINDDEKQHQFLSSIPAMMMTIIGKANGDERIPECISNMFEVSKIPLGTPGEEPAPLIIFVFAD